MEESRQRFEQEKWCLQAIGRYFKEVFEGDVPVPDEVPLELRALYRYLLARVIEVGVPSVSRQITMPVDEPYFAIYTPFYSDQVAPYPNLKKNKKK